MLAVVRSGKFHGAKFRGGTGGDQDVEFVGLIRRVKASSLTNVRDMSGVTERTAVERRTK